MSEIINYFISGIFITFVAIFFGSIFTSKKLNMLTIKDWIFCLLVLVLYTLFFALDIGPFLTVIVVIGYIYIYKFVYKISKQKSIFMGISYCLISLVVEIILFLFITAVLKLPNDYIYNVFAKSIFCNFILSAMTLIVLILIRKVIEKMNTYKFETDKLLSFISIVTVICIGVCFYANYNNIQINGKLIIITFIIIAFIFILFILLRQRIINNKISTQYDALIEFVKDYEDIIENQRINQHENKNQLISIKSKITDNDDRKKIIEYIDSLLNEKTDFSREKYSSFKYLPSNGLKGLFYYKVYNAETKGINISLNISPSIVNSNLYRLNTIEYKQLFRIIGVYIDNAIEGCLETANKIIGLEVFNDSNEISIIISNSYNAGIKKKSLHKGSKEKNRGHGLMLVDKIVDSHNIFTKETIITNDLYIQKLLIHK